MADTMTTTKVKIEEDVLLNNYIKELVYKIKKQIKDGTKTPEDLKNIDRTNIDIPILDLTVISDSKYHGEHGEYSSFLQVWGILKQMGDFKISINYSGYENNPPKLQIKIPVKGDYKEAMVSFLNSCNEDSQMTTGVELPESWTPDKFEKGVWYKNYLGCLTYTEGVFKDKPFVYCAISTGINLFNPVKLLGKDKEKKLVKMCSKVDDDYPDLDETKFFEGKIMLAGMFFEGEELYNNSDVVRIGIEAIKELNVLLDDDKPNLDNFKEIIEKFILPFNEVSLSDKEWYDKVQERTSPDSKVWVSEAHILPFRLKMSVYQKIDRLPEEIQDELKEKYKKDTDFTKIELLNFKGNDTIDEIIKSVFWSDSKDEYREKYEQLSHPFSLGSVNIINKTFEKGKGDKSSGSKGKSFILAQNEEFKKMNKKTKEAVLEPEPAIPVNSFQALAVDSDEEA